MVELFTKRYHPPGTAPGTLAPTTETDLPPARVRVLQFVGERVDERVDCDLDDCSERIAGATLWCHLQGHPSTAQLARLGELFHIHPLALEDIANRGQRPKLDLHDEGLFLVLNQPVWQDGAIMLDEVNLFVGEDFVVSVHSGEHDPFDAIRRRLRVRNRNFVQIGAPYLAYTLVDLVIDQAFPILEDLGTILGDLEATVLDRPDKGTLGEIHHARRELMLLRRQLWPTREVIGRLLREGGEIFPPVVEPYLRDVYDHCMHIVDLLESYRDMTTSLVDAYMSSVNQRLNEIMRVLTVIATIFIPLTFLVGVYGMNFSHPESPWAMPELHAYYGYPLLWLLMVAIAGSMLFIFRRRGWF